MTSYTFEQDIHSDESIMVTPEEQEEVFRLMAAEAEAAEGYSEWSEQVEEAEEPAKDWLHDYCNRQSGPTHQGWDI